MWDINNGLYKDLKNVHLEFRLSREKWFEFQYTLNETPKFWYFLFRRISDTTEILHRQCSSCKYDLLYKVPVNILAKNFRAFRNSDLPNYLREFSN